MMKFVKAGLLAMSAAVGLAQTAAAATVFEGRLVITSAAGCADTVAGERWSAHYVIANLGTNPAQAVLSLVKDLDAESYVRTGNFTNVFSNAAGSETSTGLVTNFVAQVRFTSTPLTGSITTATNFVSLAGQIKNKGNDANGAACFAAFRAAFVRRP